jgi:glucosylglycerate synthase
LREGHRVVEVPLGRKLHNSPFPKILQLPQQVLDSLFHVVVQVERVRPTANDVRTCRVAIDGTATRQDPDVVARVVSAVGHYVGTHTVGVHGTFPSARELIASPWGLRITTDHWPHILADALDGVAHGCFEAARDHLVALYVNRVLTFWDEIEGLREEEIDELLDRQATETAKAVESRSITFRASPVPPGFDRGHWAGIQ